MKQGAMSETGDLPLTQKEINAFLGKPSAGVLETLSRIEDDVMILGVAGKMGATAVSMMRQGFNQLGKKNRILGVSRFSSDSSRKQVEEAGATTIACDLIDREAVQKLPEVRNILFLAGQKFGSSGSPDLTWAMNTIVPGYVAERFAKSRIVVFSTGCVYPFVDAESGGSREGDAIEPMGDYANSCVGRERIFSYFSRKNGTPMAIYRLNYSIDLRYGVLVDIAERVAQSEPVDVTTGYVNVIWQGDAVCRAIQLLDHCDTPPFILNVTGPETVAVRDLAERFGKIFSRPARIVGKEQPTAWLSNASKSIELFGPPKVTLDQMIQRVADYLTHGGELLGKRTCFEARNGKF
jgi:nucleoside-diphosphate-sugar epimerase